MQDRGEKIVTLAREILRSDELPKLPESSIGRITLSFKMLCLATVLTGLGSSAVTGWIVEMQRPLNHYERTELDALVFYAAREKGLKEEDLRHEMLAKLNLTGFDAMTEGDFLTARRYLQNKAN
jgi:hypothetical protein